MALPRFTHIHCSSRYDSSEHLLEADLDDFMNRCSVLTMTEMRRDYRAEKLREQGWNHYNVEARNSLGQDNCAIAWNTGVWSVRAKWVRRCHQRPGHTGGGAPVIYAITVLLKHRDGGQTLLVSATHMPANVEGDEARWKHSGRWRARKQTYFEIMRTWSGHIADLERKKRPDGVLIASDWNLNLKEDWVRDFIRHHWGKRYQQAWTRFPTAGGTFHGGPVAPLGAPGVAKGDKIIDGTIYHGLKLDEHPNLMRAVASSDHRPYIESFRFQATGERDDDDRASGDRKPGDPWWGFGDYQADEIYEVARTTGSAGGEVL